MFRRHQTRTCLLDQILSGPSPPPQISLPLRHACINSFEQLWKSTSAVCSMKKKNWILQINCTTLQTEVVVKAGTVSEATFKWVFHSSCCLLKVFIDGGGGAAAAAAQWWFSFVGSIVKVQYLAKRKKKSSNYFILKPYRLLPVSALNWKWDQPQEIFPPVTKCPTTRSHFATWRRGSSAWQ